ncbi:hypothetical protein PG995_002722 [Apiospora arundinis]
MRLLGNVAPVERPQQQNRPTHRGQKNPEGPARHPKEYFQSEVVDRNFVDTQYVDEQKISMMESPDWSLTKLNEDWPGGCPLITQHTDNTIRPDRETLEQTMTSLERDMQQLGVDLRQEPRTGALGQT